MYSESLRNNIINKLTKSRQCGFITNKRTLSKSITKKHSLNNFTNNNNYLYKKPIKIIRQQFDDYLLNRNHKNSKTVKTLKKEIDVLKNRLGICQAFIGKVSNQNIVLKRSLEKMKNSTTRLSGNSRQDFTRQTKQVEDDHTMNKYLPQNSETDYHRRIKSELANCENKNNLNYSQESEYQLLTPAHKFVTKNINQSLQSFGTEDIEQLTTQLDELVLIQAKCKQIQKKREMRAKILKISERINILQKNKTKDRFFQS